MQKSGCLNDKENKIIIIKDGQEVICDIYYSFISDEKTNKGYVAYSDHSKDENGNENIYMGSFRSNQGMKHQRMFLMKEKLQCLMMYLKK